MHRHAHTQVLRADIISPAGGAFDTMPPCKVSPSAVSCLWEKAIPHYFDRLLESPSDPQVVS